MKQILFSMLFAILFIACDKNEESLPDLTKIRIKERPCEVLEYVGKIGNDFDLALDSLRKLKNSSSEIIKESLEVLFDCDNRQFWGIAYGDCGMYTDVLDTKGNYYLRTWYCPDQNATEEETIFENNKIFNIKGGCETMSYKSIIYTNKLGNDFASALDSLIKLKEQASTINIENCYIETEAIAIDFSYDDRLFYLIGFMDTIRQFHVSLDVIDSKGNHFDIIWCDD
jgi:hypothetical protein